MVVPRNVGLRPRFLAFPGMTGWGAGPGWPRAIGPPRATRGEDWRVSTIHWPAPGGRLAYGHAPPGKLKQNVGWFEARTPTSLLNRKPVGVRSSLQPSTR